MIEHDNWWMQGLWTVIAIVLVLIVLRGLGLI
jgi:hypothetical protein